MFGSSVSDDGVGGVGEGLVPYSTTHPEGVERKLLPLGAQAARLKRMKQGTMTAARLIQAELDASGSRWIPWMITPTYRPGVEWQPEHITGLLNSMRKWADRQGFKLRYVWVAEIQQGRWMRGDSLLGECVHYHLLIWCPACISPPKPDKQGWWKHGMTQRIRVKKPLSYLLKYSSKGSDVGFPKGLRIHGCGGLCVLARNHRTWWMSPRWVRVLWSDSDLPRRAVGGGWVSRVTGEWLPSIYKVFLICGGWFVGLRDDLDEVMPEDKLLLLSNAGVL